MTDNENKTSSCCPCRELRTNDLVELQHLFYTGRYGGFSERMRQVESRSAEQTCDCQYEHEQYVPATRALSPNEASD